MTDNPKKKSEDVAVVLGPSADGFRVVRIKGDPEHPDSVAAGIVRPMVPGQGTMGECVTLKQRGVSPVFDIETFAERAPTGSDRGGPAQVATDAYRAGWERVFKGVKPDENAN